MVSRRRSRLPITLIALFVCLALFASLLMPFRLGEAKSLTTGQGQSRKGRPVSGAPEVGLPNLNEVRHRRHEKPEAPAAIPSSIRSRRNPLEPSSGRIVSSGRGSQHPPEVADRIQLPHSKAKAISERQIKLSHARSRKALTFMPPPVGDDSYVQNFFQAALARQPYGYEQSYWLDILRAAFQRGQNSMVMAAREMGKTLFESVEYASRNRDNHSYVYDMYRSYAMRDPEPGGWAYWEAMLPSQGREAVRRAFDDQAGEFGTIVSSISVVNSPSSSVSSLLSARVDPTNQAGNGLLGRDAEWSLPLVSLPGRSGLDLGLTLSYSSMVWTRSGSDPDHPYLYFDEDNGSPSPGFRLGFPAVQEQFFDAQVGQNVYLLITPSGGRTELRQVGSTTIYEAADSSYLQLIDYGSILVVRSIDGTQLNYTKLNNEWRCNQIKDRNGNYLTINYNWRGQITTVKDTLERQITFNYDGNSNLLSITQDWNGQTHEWATFGWSTVQIQPGFSGNISGITYAGTIPVVTQIGLADHSYYKFIYSTSLTGQVSRITYYGSDSNPASDNHPLNYTTFEYESTSMDCPRISAIRVWGEYWNNANGVPAEVTTQYSDLLNGSHQLVAPDGTVYKEFYGSGWQKGLTTLSEVWSGGVRQKWSTTSWIQDNTGVSYLTNPRPVETNVYDAASNRRRTTIGYKSFTLPSGVLCSLTNDVTEYLADAVTPYRRTHTDYLLTSVYLDKRIIGLPEEVFLDDGGSNKLLETHYGYDWASHLEAMPGNVNPVQHDASYNTSLTTRGNLVLVTQNNVDPNPPPGIEFKYGYNVAGSVTFTRDMLWHQNFVSYSDSFSDLNNGRNTFAYPTTVYDNDWNGTYIRYNFDFGAKTRHKGPPAAGQPQGAIQTLDYDSAGRLERTTMTDNGAYTRYVYGANYVQSFSTVNTVGYDEAYTIQIFNGLGQPFGIAGNHPGSAGWYKAQNIKYDLMGQVIKQSNPTEINDSWIPYGDDAAGWLYMQQTYDWKGRPLETINTDDTPTNPSRKQFSYSGCGCAGGEVVTLTDEGTIENGTLKRRQQKIYSDLYGRTAKTEVLNWQGGSVYATTVNTYNQRDQVTQVRQYAGAEGSGTYQDTTTSYDGFGRLWKKHTPEQDLGTNTTWDYNTDDTIQKVTDARGATATYEYNGRHQPTSIVYAAPTGITPTPKVTLAYDNAGNRVSMTEKDTQNNVVGGTTYEYDRFSRLTSETRTFPNVGAFTMTYGYNLANQLTSVTDHFGAQVSYNHDPAGRLSSVTGSGFANVSTYASNLQYRAAGGIKHLSYGNNLTLDIDYNARLHPSSFVIPNVINKTYQYTNDGLMSYSHDRIDQRFDRAYTHDQMARMTQALSGAEARGEAATNDRPYKQTYGYDNFSHLTTQNSNHWTAYFSSTDSYTNNRRADWSYDASGNLLSNFQQVYTYDAAGQMATVHSESDTQQSFDGNGNRVKTVESGLDANDQPFTTTTYYLRSSVLGGKVLTELSGSGAKQRTFVYSGSQVLATQEVGPTNLQQVIWEHRDASNASVRHTSNISGYYGSSAELDPASSDAGLYSPYDLIVPYPSSEAGESLLPYGSFGSPQQHGVTYSRDGIPVPRDYMMGIMNNFVSGGFSMAYGMAADSARVVGYRKTGIRLGRAFELNYDANGQMTSEHWESVNVNLGGPTTITTLYASSSSFWTSITPQDTGSRRFTGDEVKDLRSRVAKLLVNGRCAKFLTNVLNKAAKLAGQDPVNLNEILDTFDKIETQGGFHYDYAMKRAGEAKGGINGNTPASVLLSPNGYSPRPGYAERQIASAAIHEIIHHLRGGRGFLDSNLAQGLGFKADPKWNAEKLESAASVYWGYMLASACDPGDPKK
ncbi:MAG: hypothetical protein QOD75_119 [Blastocatellia bacterium]|jgi:YD repeat-containing protein|nr:hypothetical protein [Blastocatellia bacterium]